MCVLVVHLYTTPGYSIVAGASRDEATDRPSAPPALDASGRVFAPTDLRAGGTWLGVNRDGVFAAITNRSAEPVVAARPSRGDLCRIALAAASANEAADRVGATVQSSPRNGFNLVVADRHQGIALAGVADRVRRLELAPGTHVVTNLHEPDTFDLGSLLRRGAAAADDDDDGDVDAALARLAAICRDHTDRGGYRVCKHREGYGTVSSALIAIGDGPAHPSRFLYADGPPCRTPYDDMSAAIAAWPTVGRHRSG